MVKLSLEMKKRDVVWVSLVIVLLGVGVVFAFGTNDPVTFGHSAGEIDGLSGGSGVGNVFSGSVDVMFTNGFTYSSTPYVTFPEICNNPKVVSQPIGVRFVPCEAGAKGFLHSYVSSLDENGFLVYLETTSCKALSAGSSSLLYRIDWVAFCD